MVRGVIVDLFSLPDFLSESAWAVCDGHRLTILQRLSRDSFWDSLLAIKPGGTSRQEDSPMASLKHGQPPNPGFLVGAHSNRWPSDGAAA
jgi:hypothetical protein